MPRFDLGRHLAGAGWSAPERLVVDYYRVGRRLSYPLPVTDGYPPLADVPGIAEYPWSTWLTWTLEEHLAQAGYRAELLGDGAARAAAERDLTGLAGWPEYCAFRGGPSLDTAHAARMMVRALRRWSWPADDLRARLVQALRRLVDEYGSAAAASPEPKHNIPLIAELGAALAATVADHPAAPDLNSAARRDVEQWMAAHDDGYSEGVAYDGYVLGFALGWAEAAGVPLHEHPSLPAVIAPSLALGVPGSPVDVAPLSDVEPREMSFHVAAAVMLARRRPDLVPGWYLDAVLASGPAEWLKFGLLEALDGLSWESAPPPGPRAVALTYAAVARTGETDDDLAVAVSAPRSEMGHVHRDAGSLVFGHRGVWWIDDPGYQQYCPGDEREFTVGPLAHNGPVVGGVAPTLKAATAAATDGMVVVDLTACYPEPVGRVERLVTLLGRRGVAMADRLERPAEMAGVWHFHPSLTWWVAPDRLLLERDGTLLEVHAPGAALDAESLARLPGTRGQMTLRLRRAPARVTWTVFAFGPTEVTADDHGLRGRIGDEVFDFRLPD